MKSKIIILSKTNNARQAFVYLMDIKSFQYSNDPCPVQALSIYVLVLKQKTDLMYANTLIER
jgi:hypothetical protein